MTDPREFAADPRVREVLNSLAEGITIADATGRILFSNSAADELLGATASDGPPETWAEHYGVFLPDGATPFPTDRYPLVRALEGEATRGVEMLVRNRGVPQGVIISVTGRPMRSPAGAVTGAAVVFRDVTELRTAEEQLRHSIRARDEFSAFIVHDLKGPLTAVMTLVDLLLLTAPLKGEDRDVATDIKRAARSMHGMVMDLLDVHVAESGQMALHVQPIRVVDVFNELIEATSAAVRAHGQRLVVHAPDEHIDILADPDLIDRVVFNLIDNCVKYVPKGGTITLRAVASGDRVRIEVDDDGPGVPEEFRDTIFERFSRLNRQAIGRDRDSRGVGLSFAKAVVEAHGGRIWVEDNVPTGARFCVELAGRNGGAEPAALTPGVPAPRQ